MNLTSKERVQIALNHEEPDRVPYQAWFVPEIEILLRKRFKNKLDETKERRYEKYQKMIELDLILGHDMLFLSHGISTGYYRDTGSETYLDEWGITWKKVYYKTRNGAGYYTEIVNHPLADEDRINNYKVPNPDDEDIEYSEEIIKRYGKDFYICGSIDCSIFESLKYLRGFSQSFIDLISNKDIANKVMDLSVGYHLKLGQKLINMGVDMLWLADDIGGENSLLLSPEIFRKMIKPKMDYMIRELKKKNKDIKIAFHSDGNIEQVIDDLVEVGVDLLNPIQPESMDPTYIKKRYGKRISLWGTVSVQKTFTFGKTKDIEREVRERIKSCGPGGGLILSPASNIQLDTPLENIDVFYKTIEKYGKYPIKI